MASITDLITRPGYETRWERFWRVVDLPALLPGALLAALMVWSVNRSIYQSGWAGESLSILSSVALGGLLVGIVFARLPWLAGWLAHLLSALLGGIWAVQRLGSTLDLRLGGWSDYASELLIRIIAWGRVLAAGERGEDIILFVTATALLAWLLGYATAWLLFRLRSVWPVVVINAVAILVNYTFALPKPNLLFFVFLGGALLLIAQQNISRQQQDWQAAQIEFPEAMGLRFLTASALFCAVIILVTSLLPGEVSIQRAKLVWGVISQPGQALRHGWEDAFSTINAPPGASGSGFAARSAQLTGARVLGNELVMLVRSERPDYWRAVARDRYDGRSWENTTGDRARAAIGAATVAEARTVIAPGQPLPRSTQLAGPLITQTFELRQERRDDFVLAGTAPLRLSIGVGLEHSLRPQPGAPAVPNYDDLAAIVSTEPLLEGTSYVIEASAAVADEQSLRLAGNIYPDWVRDRYLQVPESVSERTHALARKIVSDANATNPYDMAIAIQSYLRRFPYNERIAAPPRGVDAVDYFLFEAQQGYCDYYASAMAVMLRSLDVPTRWVNGYATGTLNAELNAYEVRTSVAHTWPEVYFPGLGWQRFEPTPAAYANLPARPTQPLGEGAEGFEEGLGVPLALPQQDLSEQERRLAEQEARSADGSDDDDAAEAQASGTRVGVLVLAVLLAGGGFVLLWLRRRSPASSLLPATTAYARLTLVGRLAGLPQPAHATPREYQQLLMAYLPEQHDALGTIVQGYIRERYRPGTTNSPREIEAAWQRLRGPLLRLVLPWNRGKRKS